MPKQTGPGLAAMACAFVTSIHLAAAAVPAPDGLGGTMTAELDGRAVAFPLLRTDISAEIAGDLATVAVVQTFANPGTTPLDATYLFPLDDRAAVYRMTMAVGDEVIDARIAERAAARAAFDRAKSEGRNAALLEQHRPNMFTQSVANLMPGVPITVTLRYVQTVPRVDGTYELVVPLVVGPRYEPGPQGRAAAAALQSAVGSNEASPAVPGQWSFGPAPAYPPVAGLTIPPRHIEADRVGLTVALDGGMPITDVASPSHALVTAEDSPQRRRLTLASGRTLDNRDFVLRYRLAGDRTAAGLLAQHDARGGFFSLLLEPPQVPQADDVARREMVFVLDCSGSMHGLPLQASKAFMRRALDRLRPGDVFRIIRFSDAATQFSTSPLPATPANIRLGKAYVDGLISEGGTNVHTGIHQALAVPPSDGALRLVTFLTDGYIGNEEQILRLIHDHLGSARLFAFGVGSSVNRFLLNEMGRIGRGFTRYMDPTEDIDTVAEELAGRLQSPVLTDITIDWGGLAPHDLTADAIADLFAGQSLRLQGRYDKPGRYTVRIRGKVAGRSAELPVAVDLPESGGSGEAVPMVWARMAVEREMNRLLLPQSLRPAATSDSDIQARVTRLGLDFSLVTQWTSFVAIANRRANPEPRLAQKASVPVPMVAGVGPGAYGLPAAAAGAVSNTGFTGSPAPEPASGLGMLAVMLTLAWAARQRRDPLAANADRQRQRAWSRRT